MCYEKATSVFPNCHFRRTLLLLFIVQLEIFAAGFLSKFDSKKLLDRAQHRASSRSVRSSHLVTVIQYLLHHNIGLPGHYPCCFITEILLQLDYLSTDFISSAI